MPSTTYINDTYKDGTIATRLSCVYLTFYNGTKLPPYYIGSCYVDNIIDNNYNGSVASKKYASIWKQEQKNNRHLFDTIILHYFGDREEATEFEAAIQYNEGCSISELYSNMSIANSTGISGPTHHSEETKKVLSELSKGRGVGLKRTVKTKSRMSASAKHSWKSGQRKPPNRSHIDTSGSLNSMYGKIQKDSTKLLIKESIARRQFQKKVYVTPQGITIFKPTRWNWCVNYNKIITNLIHLRCPNDIPMSAVGGTFEELGYNTISHKDYLSYDIAFDDLFNHHLNRPQ